MEPRARQWPSRSSRAGGAWTGGQVRPGARSSGPECSAVGAPSTVLHGSAAPSKEGRGARVLRAAPAARHVPCNWLRRGPRSRRRVRPPHCPASRRPADGSVPWNSHSGVGSHLRRLQVGHANSVLLDEQLSGKLPVLPLSTLDSCSRRLEGGHASCALLNGQLSRQVPFPRLSTFNSHCRRKAQDRSASAGGISATLRVAAMPPASATRPCAVLHTLVLPARLDPPAERLPGVTTTPGRSRFHSGH